MARNYVSRYVTEEQDCSDSDCLSDGQMCHHTPLAPSGASDVTEIYRRQHQAQQLNRNSQGAYYHTHSVQGYYEPPSRCGGGQNCGGCNFQVDPRYCYYKMPANNNEGAFRASHIMPTNLRTCHDTAAAAATATLNKTAHIAATKKYPVTARTPRYYKNSAAPVCKRPSTLCLPVTCQPDPASSTHHARPRKLPPPPLAQPETHQYRGQEGFYPINECCATMKRSVKTVVNPHAIDSEGDVNSRFNDLENLLTKFGQENDNDDIDENDLMEMATVTDLSKILKPKVPASIKARQEQCANLKCGNSKASANNEPATIAAAAAAAAAAAGNTSAGNGAGGKFEMKEGVPPDDSFDKLLRRLSRENLHENADKFKEKTIEFSKDMNRILSVGSGKRPTYFQEQKPPLDDNSALELHKSKSYIVSLIDKALSKELGTVPGEKCSRQEFLNMNPKRAIDLVNRHTITKYCEKPLSLPENHSTPTTSKRNSYECNKVAEQEPHYMKQLKQLRWSHLKHIQREAKRLADLEHFLESFQDNNDNSP